MMDFHSFMLAIGTEYDKFRDHGPVRVQGVDTTSVFQCFVEGVETNANGDLVIILAPGTAYAPRRY